MKNVHELFGEGVKLVSDFCQINEIPTPPIHHYQRNGWPFSACAYYRPDTGINICVTRCSQIGNEYRCWSYPGYTADRTPYGVLAHELGHHVDLLKGDIKGKYWSDFGIMLRKKTNEPPITNYCPNSAEWFAEMMRLFITNPDFLARLRPLTYREIIASGLKPVFNDDWLTRLAGAPERTIKAACNKIVQSRGKS